jgi:hypothetical protein
MIEEVGATGGGAVEGNAFAGEGGVAAAPFVERESLRVWGGRDGACMPEMVSITTFHFSL